MGEPFRPDRPQPYAVGSVAAEFQPEPDHGGLFAPIPETQAPDTQQQSSGYSGDEEEGWSPARNQGGEAESENGSTGGPSGSRPRTEDLCSVRSLPPSTVPSMSQGTSRCSMYMALSEDARTDLGCPPHPICRGHRRVLDEHYTNGGCGAATQEERSASTSSVGTNAATGTNTAAGGSSATGCRSA